MAAPTLNQLVAVQSGLKTSTYRDQTDMWKSLQRPAPLTGISRQYTPRDEEGESLPPESTLVQVSAETVLQDTAQLLGKLFDTTATIDAANCTARADLAVRGQVLAKDVPVTTLLFLEKQIQDLVTTMRALPKLDPAEKWSFDEATNSWRSEPYETVRTKKVLRNHVKAEATDKHPAQVEIFTEDVGIGTWRTVRFSGAMPATRVAALVSRAEDLLRAIKMARETANQETAVKREIAAPIFTYLLAQ